MTELDETQQKQPEGKSGNANGTRILVMLAAAIVILIGLRELRDLLIPIMLAAFLAIISYSVTDLLRKRAHFPHWLAVICTLIVNAGILFAIGTLIRFLAADMARTLQGEVIIKTQEKLNEVVHWLDNWGLGAEAQHVISAPQEYVGMDRLFTLSQTVGASAISFTVNKRNKYKVFESLVDFLSALEYVIKIYSHTAQVGMKWREKFVKSYKDYYGVDLNIPLWQDIAERYNCK